VVLTCGYPMLGFSVEAIGPRNNITSIPEFIRPAINPRAVCNIWGPLCQTGSIVVGVNITNMTSKTTVPCSEYLSAQAESAMHGYLASRGKNDVYLMGLDDDYHLSFGRSPECKSYADHFPMAFDPAVEITTSEDTVQHASRLRRAPHEFHLSADANLISKRSGSLTYSNCGSNQLNSPEYYIPPGISRSVYGFGGPMLDYYCCGDCTLRIDEIRLLYFPGPTTFVRSCTNDCCSPEFFSISRSRTGSSF
jgi:hypothetical protein